MTILSSTPYRKTRKNKSRLINHFPEILIDFLLYSYILYIKYYTFIPYITLESGTSYKKAFLSELT